MTVWEYTCIADIGTDMLGSVDNRLYECFGYFYPLNFLLSLTETKDAVKTAHWIVASPQVRDFERHFHSFYNQNAPLGSSSLLNCLLHTAAPHPAISV